MIQVFYFCLVDSFQRAMTYPETKRMSGIVNLNMFHQQFWFFFFLKIINNTKESKFVHQKTSPQVCQLFHQMDKFYHKTKQASCD